MSEPRQYMLMEVVGDGPRFPLYSDSWLCPIEDYADFLECMLSQSESTESVSVKFTFLEMTDDEHAAYCEEHGIDWE